MINGFSARSLHKLRTLLWSSDQLADNQLFD